jgi:uncharacterized protein YraI
VEEFFFQDSFYKKGNVMKYVKNFLKVGLVLAVLLVSAANAGGTTSSSGSTVRPTSGPATTYSKSGWGG